MTLLKDINEMAALGQPDVQDEMHRIADYWRENGQDMPEEELRSSIAMDLEQLEYSPEQAEQLIPQVMQMLRGV